MSDQSDPFGIWGVRNAGQIAPDTFHCKVSLFQLFRDGVNCVVLKPIPVNRYFSISFDNGELIKPDSLFRIIETFLQQKVGSWFAETAFHGLPVVFDGMV